MKTASLVVALCFLTNAAQAEQRDVTVGGETIRFDRLLSEDTDGDGRNDRISCYDGESLVLTIYDTDNDDKPDLWLTFDRRWRAKAEMRDTNRDGEPDQVRVFDGDDQPSRQEPIRAVATAEKKIKKQAPEPVLAPAPTAPVKRQPAPALRLAKTRRYSRVWTDMGSGADDDFATFRARPENGFFPIGDTAVASPWKGQRYAPPDFDAWLVAGGELPVKPPIDFKPIWTVAGSPADQPFSSWQAVPPRGYRCLGDVGVAGLRDKPPREAIRCVPEQCVERTQVRDRIWDDNGSNAHDDFSAWSTPTPAVYIGNRSHGRPGRAIYRLKQSCFERR